MRWWRLVGSLGRRGGGLQSDRLTLSTALQPAGGRCFEAQRETSPTPSPQVSNRKTLSVTQGRRKIHRDN